MHFWDLPEDIFHDILVLLEAERQQERRAILQSLRLTSKRLAEATESAFFSTISVKLEDTNLTSRLALASKLGRFVKTLTLDLWVNTDQEDWAQLIGIEERDDLLSQLIRLLPNLHDLTLRILRDSRLRLPKITQVFEETKLIRSLQVMEIPGKHLAFEAYKLENVSEVLDKIISQIIQSSGKELQYLSFDTKSSISVQTFKLLRAEATSLRAATFRDYIGVACREILCEDTLWACRNTLQYLSFLDCRGAHGGAIACGIANGLWARNLRRLEVSTCGKMDDVTEPPYPIVLSSVAPPVSLERASYEHEILWELDLLGKIPVRILALTRINEDTIATLLEQGAFPLLEKLEIDSTGNRPPHERISDACDRRRVKLVTGAPRLVDF